MKGLLVFILLIGLVFGTFQAFAGTVHNNGPGAISKAFYGPAGAVAVIFPAAANAVITGIKLSGDSNFYNEFTASTDNYNADNRAAGGVIAKESVPVTGRSKTTGTEKTIVGYL